jgi:hypothetical protein
MSEKTAKRQRRTNQLARAAADHLFKNRELSPGQLYGLCKLTWITDSYEGLDAAYVKSTKTPALGEIFKRDYSEASIDEVAIDAAAIVGSPAIKHLILSDTGFTNFYKAYRNTARTWIEDNYDLVLPLFRSASKLETDTQGLKLIRKIKGLPGIPKANHHEQLMKPEYLLTPAFFSLDGRLRFPLINGNEGVKNLLARLKVTRAPLDEQYQKMIGLYGIGGIADAADLDQAGRDLPDFIAIDGRKPTKKLLERKPTEGSELPLKDESDIQSLQKARTVINRRIHNQLTNKLKTYLSGYTLLEGSSKAAMFDVLVKDFDHKGADLLVEVKSSDEMANIRMAVGQLFDYWFSVIGRAKPRVAVLLPSMPDDDTKTFLEWLRIGLLWFSDEKLATCSDWLKGLTD